MPGPPDVMILGRSTILNASIMRMSMTVAATGMICGQVISLNICQPLAPSTWPASIWSRGTFSSAASRITNTNGIHCQVSPIMMKTRAAHASAAHAKSSSPNHCHSSENGPLVVSAIIRKLYPTPIGVTMSGMKNTTRKNVLPRTGWAHNNASPSPIRNCTAQPKIT